MHAMISTRYGTPDVLQLKEIPTPTPQAHEVLIKVCAAVVGPSDCAFRKGEPFIVKLLYGLRQPRITTQGVEFSGVVVAVGTQVKQFQPGDEVLGMSPDKFGAHAEYICLPENQLIIPKPAAMSHADGVGVLDGGLTALTFLRDVAHVQPGQKVLINGASGAVGAYAVQLAKYFGAEVTGVCSTVNIPLVRSLGADEVIDYTQADFTRCQNCYDIIFDAVGKSTFTRCKAALTTRGLYLTTVPTVGIVFDMLRTRLIGRKKAIFAAAGLMQTRENLSFVADLTVNGKLKAVIDRAYPLAETAAAHRYVETGRKKGNVIITMP